jgi:cation-transporting ATPase 13A2
MQKFTNGISDEDAEKLIKLYGPCFIQIPIPGVVGYLSTVMTEPFFLLQYFTVIVWVLEGFAYFALIMVGGTLISCLFNYYLLRTSMV